MAAGDENTVKTKLVEAEVSEGRSVVADKTYGPGEKVKLVQSEVDSLRASGYLVDPNAEVIPVGDGPTFTVEGGPKVTKKVAS